jgi:hypothetical protein
MMGSLGEGQGLPRQHIIISRYVDFLLAPSLTYGYLSPQSLRRTGDNRLGKLIAEVST